MTVRQRVSGIYKISNTQTGSFYIGSSNYIKSRWAGHRMQLRRGTHKNRYVQAVYNKYGESVFEFSVVEECEKAVLLEREQFYIDTLKPNYNLAPKAGNNLGAKQSEETKQKLREIFKGRTPSNKGVPHKESTKQLLKEAWERRRLKPVSQETKDKISKALKGKPKPEGYKESRVGIRMSEDAKAKISAGNKGKKRTDEIKQKLSEVQKTIILTRQRDASGKLK